MYGEVRPNRSMNRRSIHSNSSSPPPGSIRRVSVWELGCWWCGRNRLLLRTRHYATGTSSIAGADEYLGRPGKLFCFGYCRTGAASGEFHDDGCADLFGNHQGRARSVRFRHGLARGLYGVGGRVGLAIGHGAQVQWQRDTLDGTRHDAATGTDERATSNRRSKP